MKVSVITVTWNSGATLRDTLESVLRQTYLDIEHIIVDGGSTDNTMELVREYEHATTAGYDMLVNRTRAYMMQ